MLVLFRFLAKYDFEYHVVYDDLGWPWSDKPFSYMLDRACKAIDSAMEQGCMKVIVPPVVELALRDEKKYKEYIMPLFSHYMLDECMSASAVGKIGFAGEYNDLQQKALFESVASTYVPNEKQQQRVSEVQKKKPAYKWDVNFWWKEITMWKFYLTKISFKDWMVHHSMKADWRYFKDALVDTIVPTSYGFFAYETALSKFLNNRKQKFHRLSAVEKQFSRLIQNSKLKTQNYAVNISYTGTLDHLIREKKWMWMLQRGSETKVNVRQITF